MNTHIVVAQRTGQGAENALANDLQALVTNIVHDQYREFRPGRACHLTISGHGSTNNSGSFGNDGVPTCWPQVVINQPEVVHIQS